MINLSTSGNAVVFTFTDSDRYLYGTGTITVPLNSLLLVTDNSQMATFKKAASNDVFVSALYSELGMTKDELISWFETNAVGSTGGGGGGGITSGDVQTMINTSLEDYSTSDEVATEIDDAVSVKLDASAYTPTVVDSTFDSGSTNPLANSAITDHLNTVESVIATSLVDLDNRKLDASAYTPTDLSNYYTSAQTESAITVAVSGKQDTLVSGRGISIDTANTISFNLPISAGTGNGSVIIGDNGNSSYSSYASGRGAVVFPSRLGYGSNYATEESSFAHGNGCSAGTCSHAEGYNTKCINGFNSHSEGESTEARGANSHSEGQYTLAGITFMQKCCHSEGEYTSALTSYSHAEGSHTITRNNVEHSQGKYNVSVSATTTFGDSGNTLFSVGNGTADNARHNAFEIRQNGDIYCNNGTSDVKLQDYIQFKIAKLTQSEYDALVQAGTVDANTVYFITTSNS